MHMRPATRGPRGLRRQARPRCTCGGAVRKGAAIVPSLRAMRPRALMPTAHKRPVSAVADFTEVRDVVTVDVRENRDIAMTLLFDRESNLEERVLKEQFAS